MVIKQYKKFNIELFLICILIPETVGVISSTFAGDIPGKYAELIKPFFAPPAFIFPIAWGILYFLMGISDYIVKTSMCKNKSNAYFYYSAQLAVNFLWSIFFFGMEIRFFSFIWLILLIFLIILNIKSFYKIEKKAGILLIPYLIWCIYAAFLNFGLWYLNR